MSYVWGVAFSKDIGAEKTPRSNSARTVSAVYALLALIMVNTYCANLMAFLLDDPYKLPISGVKDAKVSAVYRNLVQLSMKSIKNCSVFARTRPLIGSGSLPHYLHRSEEKCI